VVIKISKMSFSKSALSVLFVNLFFSVCFSQVHSDLSHKTLLNNEKEAILDEYRKNIKKGRLPFDGEWTDAWNNKILAEEGKIYKQYSQKYLGRKLKYGVGIAHSIKYIEPGKYSNEDGSSYVKIIGKDRIIVTGKLSDFILIKVKLKDEKWFSRECDYFLQKNKKRDPVPPYIVIENVSIVPKIVAPGKPIKFLIGYKAADITGKTDLPVSFSYSIFENEQKLLQSGVSELIAKSGQLMTRKVLLNASPSTGEFEVRVNMKFKDIAVDGKAGFLISDDPMVAKNELNYKDIAGKYELYFVTNTSKFEIISTGDGMLIHHINPPNKYTFQLLSYKLENKILTFTEKSISEELECWYIVETEVDFSSGTIEKPLKSRTIDGNWCVVIGETFKGTLKKIEE